MLNIGTDEFARVASPVSDYAGENALEFLAEVYAALRTGVPVPGEALRLYGRLLTQQPPL